MTKGTEAQMSGRCITHAIPKKDDFLWSTVMTKGTEAQMSGRCITHAIPKRDDFLWSTVLSKRVL
jgi:hypothetical protein